MTGSRISVRRLSGFDDPDCAPAIWNRLLSRGETDVVFLTWEWVSTWWEVFGRGELLLLAAVREGELVAIAPWFAEAGMVYPIGVGSSDYLDLVGDISDAEVLPGLLSAAVAQVNGFIGFVLYHLRSGSANTARLAVSAPVAGLECVAEEECPAPSLDLGEDGRAGLAAAGKRSLLRRERSMVRSGGFRATHHRAAAEILPWLEAFADQHQARWEGTPFPSLFKDPRQLLFYRRITEAADGPGWLRFSRIEWAGETVAFHFGFLYRRSFLWYKPSYSVRHARSSPGQVLLRQLLIAAVEEGARRFDFGLGEEPFKARFTDRTETVRNWGLYCRAALQQGCQRETEAAS